MTGHQALLTMRRENRIPRCVWITDDDDVRALNWHEEVNHADQQRHAVIALAKSDVLEALDFRCCVGLEVHVAGMRGSARATRVHNALIDAKARRVITSIYDAQGVQLLTHGI